MLNDGTDRSNRNSDRCRPNPYSRCCREDRYRCSRPVPRSYAKPSQRIEIITFNYKVTPGRGAFAELKIEGARDKIGVYGLVSFNLVTFPTRPSFLVRSRFLESGSAALA